MEDRNRIFAMIGALVLLTSIRFLWSGSGGDHPPMGYVTGNVTLDGKPLPRVMVAFFPEKGRPSTGVADEQGNYELKYTRQVVGTKIGPSTVHFTWETGASGPVIPERYGLNKSELRADVKPGENVFDFALQSDPPPTSSKESRNVEPQAVD